MYHVQSFSYPVYEYTSDKNIQILIYDISGPCIRFYVIVAYLQKYIYEGMRVLTVVNMQWVPKVAIVRLNRIILTLISSAHTLHK